MKLVCPCGCGKTVDAESIFEGRPFALASCRRAFFSRCKAERFNPDRLLAIHRAGAGATSNQGRFAVYPDGTAYSACNEQDPGADSNWIRYGERIKGSLIYAYMKNEYMRKEVLPDWFVRR